MQAINLCEGRIVFFRAAMAPGETLSKRPVLSASAGCWFWIWHVEPAQDVALVEAFDICFWVPGIF